MTHNCHLSTSLFPFSEIRNKVEESGGESRRAGERRIQEEKTEEVVKEGFKAAQTRHEIVMVEKGIKITQRNKGGNDLRRVGTSGTDGKSGSCEHFITYVPWVQN